MVEIDRQMKDFLLFSGLEDAERRELAVIARVQSYDPDQTIFLEGEEGTGFYVVLEGRIKIYKTSPEGKEQILHLWGPGEPFGEVALFSDRFFPANAEAMEKSRVLFFPRHAFADLIQNHPSLALNMMATMSIRLHQFANLIESLSLKEVAGRLAGYFLALSEQQDGTDQIRLDLTKGQLASLLGTIPETLSRTLTRMVVKGLIRTMGRDVQILDREGLEDLAAAERRLSDFSSR